jgi:hypothetical protein
LVGVEWVQVLQAFAAIAVLAWVEAQEDLAAFAVLGVAVVVFYVSLGDGRALVGAGAAVLSVGADGCAHGDEQAAECGLSDVVGVHEGLQAVAGLVAGEDFGSDHRVVSPFVYSERPQDAHKGPGYGMPMSGAEWALAVGGGCPWRGRRC